MILAGLLTAALVALQGIFAGTEVAVSALGEEPHALADSRPAAARAWRALRANLAAFVATVQLGVTGLVAATGVVGGAWLAPALAARLLPLLGPQHRALAEGGALALVTVLLWLLCVVMGDLIPISLALSSGERFVAWFGRPLWWLSRRLQPITRLVALSSERLSRGLVETAAADRPPPPPVALGRLIEEARAEGAVHPRAAEIAVRALGFGDLTVADVMVPRNQVRAVEASASPEQLRRALLEEAHACMPVYAGTLDQVVGVLVARDALALAWERPLIVLDDLLQPPFFAPEVMRAVDLLKQLQSRRMHFAVVVDELGGTAGIVTIEDLLEELVGEIYSDPDAQQLLSIRREADGAALVPGMMPLREVNRELGCALADGDAYSTLGGLCVHLAGRIPEVGATLAGGRALRLEVVDASPRRVRLVRLRSAEQLPAPQLAAGGR